MNNRDNKNNNNAIVQSAVFISPPSVAFPMTDIIHMCSDESPAEDHKSKADHNENHFIGNRDNHQYKR